jgi:hypothetical protein
MTQPPHAETLISAIDSVDAACKGGSLKTIFLECGAIMRLWVKGVKEILPSQAPCARLHFLRYNASQGFSR